MSEKIQLAKSNRLRKFLAFEHRHHLAPLLQLLLQANLVLPGQLVDGSSTTPLLPLVDCRQVRQISYIYIVYVALKRIETKRNRTK